MEEVHKYYLYLWLRNKTMKGAHCWRIDFEFYLPAYFTPKYIKASYTLSNLKIMEIQEYISEFINHTNQNIFLTGKAGTGKTTLLRYITEHTYKNCVVAAPTGIAALNAGGITLHSLFQIPSATFIPEELSFTQQDISYNIITPVSFWRRTKMHDNKRRLLRNMELLIIDEVSMLRADTLDLIDMILRRIRKSTQPFGGVQVLFIGDLLQLPPVVKASEWNIMSKYYSGIFFFHAQVITKFPPLYMELEKVFRQSDNTFISLLNNLRTNQIGTNDIAILNKHVDIHFDSTQHPGYITLTTHNYKAELINKRGMDTLAGKIMEYKAKTEGEFPEYLYPTESTLALKEGARVMILKNDTSQPRRYYNGKLGTIQTLSAKQVKVKLDDSDLSIDIEPYEWQNIRYTLDAETNEPGQEVIGTFRQYPLRAAWAITIHKSQGLTFDKAALDLEDIFASGQAYVALSRLRSLEGTVLLSEVKNKAIVVPKDIMTYKEHKNSIEQLEQQLAVYKIKYWKEQTILSFEWTSLSEQWRKHSFGYKAETDRSVKSNYGDWANEQSAHVDELRKIALKFCKQLIALWSETSIDMTMINNRIKRAVEYFTPHFKEIASSVLKIQKEAKNQKKTKQYVKELESLYHITTDEMRLLYRIKGAVEALTKGTVPDRQELRIDTMMGVFHKDCADIAGLNETELDVMDHNHLKRKSTERKVSTQQQTLLLWRSGKKIDEIASERNLKPDTIYNHLAFLLEHGEIESKDIICQEIVDELMPLFTKTQTRVELKTLFEATQGKYPYSLLNLYRAYFVWKKKTENHKKATTDQ